MDYSVNKVSTSSRRNRSENVPEYQPSNRGSTQNAPRPHGMPSPLMPGHDYVESSARPRTSVLHRARAGRRTSGRQSEAGSTSSLPPKSPVASNSTYKTIKPKETSALYKNVPNVVGVIDTLGPGWDERWGPRDWGSEPMVRCSDGIVRRYPTFERRPDSNYLGQIETGLIYTAPSNRVTQRYGALEATGDHRQAFMVDGYAVSPIRIGSFDAYPMPNGRFMVPQPGFRDCTFACELMMRLDHQSISVDGGSGPRDKGRRRDMAEIVESLRENTGKEPHLFKWENVSYKKNLMGNLHQSRRDALRDLSKKIDQMGPCIFSKGGHVVMLDDVREHKGEFYLKIRDPFHAESVEFKDTKEFFRDQYGTKDNVGFEAIFLK